MCNCCSWIKPFKMPRYNKKEFHKKTKKRAGVILIHKESKKVLLVQVYNSFIGFPKGHSEDGESRKQNAFRELKEETGIELDSTFKYDKIVNYHSCVYFIGFVNEMKEVHLTSGEDATSAGWTHIECINKFIKEPMITSHVKKFLNTYKGC